MIRAFVLSPLLVVAVIASAVPTPSLASEDTPHLTLVSDTTKAAAVQHPQTWSPARGSRDGFSLSFKHLVWKRWNRATATARGTAKVCDDGGCSSSRASLKVSRHTGLDIGDCYCQTYARLHVTFLSGDLAKGTLRTYQTDLLYTQ